MWEPRSALNTIIASSPESSLPNVGELRALRAEIIVVLDATIDDSALRYSGTLKLANEEDILLF
jgi:hypothetical protein